MEAANLTQAEIIVAIVLALRQLDLTPILAQELQTAEGKSNFLCSTFLFTEAYTK